MRKHLIALMSLIMCCHLWAQDDYIFSPINTSDGLSDNRVRAITQLPDGRMVFATEGLVNIYDGIEFSYLHADDNKAYPVPNYGGFHLFYLDDQNRLWLKNQTKLICFDLLTERYVSNIDRLFKNCGINQPIIDYFVDSNRNSWYLTQSNKLYFRRNGENRATIFASELPALQDKAEQLYHVEVCDSLAFLFFKTGQLDCYNMQTGTFLYTDTPYDKRLDGYERTLIVVPYKQYMYQLRCGTNSGGILMRYDYHKREWNVVFRDMWQNDLFVDKDGNTWTCSKAGLRKFDSTLTEINHVYQFKLSDGNNLEGEISNQFIDRDGGLWLGTKSNGLLYYHANRFKFKRHDVGTMVHCLIDFNNELLVGTENGLYLYSNDKKEMQLFSGIPTNVFCNQLVRDCKNRIWLCTRRHGLFCIGNNGIKQFNQPFVCQYLYETINGEFYLSTDEGFGLFNPETGCYEPVENSADLGHVYQLISLSANRLMGVMYAEKGLFVYHTESKTIDYPNNRMYPYFVHSNKKYHDIFIDHRKMIWFGTQDGLFVYNPADSFSRSFFKRDGLINNNIRSITEDGQGRIWVSTSYGISCIGVIKEDKGYSFTFSNFNHFDGVVGKEFLPRSVLKSKDDHLYWGGLNGFNAIDLNRYNTVKTAHPIPVFTRFYISGKEVQAGTSDDASSVLAKTIGNTKEIKLKHDQNFISFDLSALNYVNPSQTYYAYKLEGVDPSWIEIRPSNGMGHINYTNLSPGSYQLKVKATDNSMVWSDAYAELNIRIKPPIWKTTVAYILYFILIVSALIIAMLYYTKQSKLKMQKKQQEILDQLKMAFFTNISHELKTPLSLVISPLDSILKKELDEPLKSKLSNIHKNAVDLLRLVNQLLDFRKIEMKGETLHLDYCQVDEFLQTLVDSFREFALEKGITLIFNKETSGLVAMLDSDKLKKIVNNLLSNALKYTEKGGQVVVNVKNVDEKIIISVSDSGCGILQSELPHIFDRFYQSKRNDPSKGGSGIGLHLVKEYVQMHNGTVAVQSHSSQGSTFTVEFPHQFGSIHSKTFDDHGLKAKSGFRILVVEDHVAFCKFLTQELSEYYDVITASNGADGLKKVRTVQPDLVITDVMMPIMTGTELCYQVKTDINISHIPVVLLTAKSSVEDQFEGYKVHADAYVTKPVSLDLLLLQIKNLIDKQEQRKLIFKKEIEVKPKTITTTAVDEAFIHSLMNHIDRNMSDISYGVEQLSYDMNMDRTTLYRKLTAVCGMSPVEFLRSVRLKKAAQLLKQDYSINDVASSVGFGTVSYFSKCFKAEFNVKPSQYKE